MAEWRPHLRISGTEQSVSYTAPPRGGGVEFARPAKDRVLHAQKLRGEFDIAEADAIQRGLAPSDPLLLTYVLQPEALAIVTSLERQSSGIELLSVTAHPGAIQAILRVPSGKRQILTKVLDRYETTLHPLSGRPPRQDLIESIEAIRLATERDLWTDSLPFPPPDQPVSWEVWLHHAGQDPDTTATRFREHATVAGLRVGPRWVHFPDRVVVLAHGPYTSWARAPRLLLFVAELRAAKLLATPLANAPPREQARAVQDLVRRVEPPPHRAPAVCLLDTGVDRGHPLLDLALSPEDAQSVDPSWGASDHHPQRHGTGMAGIALYGRLEEALASSDPIVLHHRLESVKLIPRFGANDPDEYGSLTQKATACAQDLAPHRARAVCLTITAADDGRDGGLPSSWSGAIDQLCAGAPLGRDPQLVVVAAGNLRDQIAGEAYAYPMLRRPDCGIEDPGQAWNALTVGAMTDLAVITHPDFASYRPLGSRGDLSPASRTSQAWPDEARDEWAFKPDLVMEGGNWAVSPTGERDTPDDLGLLTTSVQRSGALFGVTHDTSPATAAAAGLAARIMARYPSLRPETVRGLMVHSARWTTAMETRFAGRSKVHAIQPRLRCYGYGVPDFDRAVNSAENRATMIFEGSCVLRAS